MWMTSPMPMVTLTKTFNVSRLLKVSKKLDVKFNALLCWCIGKAANSRGRMHSDAQFAGSSSVPAHVEMMGFLGIGNNPMVGATVAVAVDVATALSK